MTNIKELKNIYNYICTLRAKPCNDFDTYTKICIIKELSNQLLSEHMSELKDAHSKVKRGIL